MTQRPSSWPNPFEDDESRSEKIEAAARALIKAWEVLPGNQRYSEQMIEKWINGHLGPAINDVRESLK